MLVTSCFFFFSVVMKGIQFTQLCCHISFLSFTTCFLSSHGRLLNSRKHRLFCLHILHMTCCLFERQTPVGSSETAVCEFCLSISLYFDRKFSFLSLTPRNIFHLMLGSIGYNLNIHIYIYPLHKKPPTSISIYIPA